MSKSLRTILIFFCLTLIPRELLGEEQRIPEKRYSLEIPYCAVYKTQEEIAWDMLRYGFEKIPSLKLRVIHYEDLLEVYRKTLNVMKEPEKPVQLYQER